MTRMEPGLNVPNYFGLRAGIHAALGDLTGAPVNDFVPLRLGVRVHGVIKAGNELAGQIRPVLLRQGHYFGHSLGGYVMRLNIGQPPRSGKCDDGGNFPPETCESKTL